MDLNLQGKTALVTGSSAGIGAEIAKVLGAEGVHVVVHGRDEARTNAVADEIRRAGGKAAVALGEITDSGSVNEVCDAALKATNGIDILINNAGTYPKAGWFDSKAEDWLESYNLDVVSNVRFIQCLVPGMVERGWGRVIGVSSASAVHVPSNFFPIYCTSKSAQTFLAQSLATELTGTGVTANTVSPGPASSQNNINDLTNSAKAEGRPTDWASVEKHYVDTLMQDPPVPRMIRPKEVAHLVAYVSSPLAGAITGANLIADCGYQLTGFKRQPSSLHGPRRPKSLT